jgi:hypothetical protein
MRKPSDLMASLPHPEFAPTMNLDRDIRFQIKMSLSGGPRLGRPSVESTDLFGMEYDESLFGAPHHMPDNLVCEQGE